VLVQRGIFAILMISRTTTKFIVITNPESRRGQLFQEALTRGGLPPAKLISYADLLKQRLDLAEYDAVNTIFRLESPERSFVVDRGLIAAGAELESTGSHQRISADEANKLPADLGRIWYQRQWYLGWRHCLQTWTANLQGQILNHPRDIALMFDKVQCQQILAMAEISVPRRLLPGQSVKNYEQLIALMDEQNIQRVFVKLAHGSSASGVMAYERRGAKERAITTVERVVESGESRFYNSRRIRQYHKSSEIADIINFLAAESVQVENWLPKARIDGKEFDVRVVVIGGHAHHTVIRMGNSPMTNLHLGNDRREISALPPGLTADNWQKMLATCEQAAACFPCSFYCGVDLLIAPNLQDHYILEMNSFGDLLQGITYQGLDTYEMEVKLLLTGSQNYDDKSKME
jgi:glutathione synthase/RimK-type ligase-like ATP-grasp enzyme